MTARKHNLRFECSQCQAAMELDINAPAAETSLECPSCQKKHNIAAIDDSHLQGCPICRSKDLYQNKDFTRAIGMTIFLSGVVLSFLVHPLLIFGALLIDAIIYPFFPWLITCYKCHAELRGWPKNPNLDRFQHEIGGSYEYREEKILEQKKAGE